MTTEIAATIRTARVADLDALVRMGLAFRTACAPSLRENPAQIRRLAAALLAFPNILLVAECGGSVCGMVGAAVFPHPISGDAVASELFWWVDPSARATGAGPGLLEAVEQSAHEQGCRSLTMVALADHTRVVDFYRRRGYTPRDLTFEKDL